MENRNHDALLVTLADKNFVEQAKQLFSSTYWNAGWKGDYMLLAHEIPEKDLKWFREKGILVKKCKPLTNITAHKRPPSVYDKIYIFSREFKKWKNILFLDGDIIVRANLDKLAKLNGFWAVRDLAEPKLKYQVEEKNRKFLKKNYSLNNYVFNSGVMAFSTDIIKENTFYDLAKRINEFIKISMFSDQLLLNLYFYKKWKRLPSYYNILNHILKKYKKNADGIILHFVTLKGFNNRCWNEKNPYYPEWERNLEKAEFIDLNNIPPGKKFNYFKLLRISLSIYAKYLKLQFKRNFFYNKSHPMSKKIFIYIINTPGRLIGQAGIFLKKENPDLYWKLKRTKLF